MNFKEFLWATENDALLAMIEECFENDTPLMNVLHEKAMSLYRTYLLVGGMPECVSEYVKTNDFDFVKVKHIYGTGAAAAERACASACGKSRTLKQKCSSVYHLLFLSFGSEISLSSVNNSICPYLFKC